MDKYLPVALSSLFIIFGSFLIYLSVKLKQTTKQLTKNCTDEVMAVVTDVIIKEMKSNRTTVETYYPVLQYTYCGNEYNVQSKSGSFSKYVIGQTFSLLVNPDEPEEFCFADSDKQAPAIVCRLVAFAGAATILISILMLLQLL